MSYISTLSKITDRKIKLLCEFAISEMRRLKIPGSVIGLYMDGKEHIIGLGKTSIEHPLHVTPETLFQIGSNTKPMVATAIMHLVEKGKLDLDTPVKTYLPKLKLKDKVVAETVTLRHLLNHTAGWEGDYFNDFGTGDNALEKMIAALSHLNQMTPLGEIWSYNNAAFYIAGRVLEVITEKPFEAAIKELVFSPLGMEMSFFYPDDVLLTHRFAVGHELIEKKNRVALPWAIPRASAPAGGVVSTAHDMLTFARFHMGESTANTTVLKTKSIKQMQKASVKASGNYHVGISWFLSMAGGLKVVSHGGATNGQHAGLWFVPEKNFALTWMTNSDEANTDTLFIEALKLFFEISAPIDEPIELSEDVLQTFIGKYENIEFILTVSLKEGELWLTTEHKGGFPTPDSPPMPVPPPMRIAPYAPDKIITLDEPLKNHHGEFLCESDGTLTWFRYGWRIHKKVQ